MSRRRVLSFNAPHAVRVTSAKVVNDGGECALVITVVGIEAGNKGQRAEIKYIVRHDSEEVESQGRHDLAELLRATGKRDLSDADRLLGCVFRVTMRLTATALHGKDDHG